MKVTWAEDKEIEEVFGHRKKFKDSWIKGGVIKGRGLKSDIILNERISRMSLFQRMECIWHETMHCLSPHWVFDEMLDYWNRIKEHYLEGRRSHPVIFFSSRVKRQGLNKTKPIEKVDEYDKHRKNVQAICS